MTAHLIIQRHHGALTWAVGIDMADRTQTLWPAPIAMVELTEEELALGGRNLFDRWVAENVTRPAPCTTAASPPIERASPPSHANEIHITPASPGPLVLPDGRQVEIGDGLVVMTVGRFAQLIEAARFGRGATDL